MHRLFTVSMRSLWLLPWLWALPLPAAFAAIDPVLSFDDSRIAASETPAWFKISFLDLPEDLADARDHGKIGLMVVFESEGCSYCQAFLAHTLSDSAIQADLLAHFDVIALDMLSDLVMTDFSGRPLQVKDFATAEGAFASPTVAFYGAGGERLFRGVGYYPPARFRPVLDFVIGGHFVDSDFRAYLASRTAPRSGAPAGDDRKPDPLFMGAPYPLDRGVFAAERPLFVLFEAAGCEQCRGFDQSVLANPSVRELLARVDAVRLDWSDGQTPLITPAGLRTTPSGWAEQLGVAQVPALIFFDERGREVIRFESLVLRQRTERALLYMLEKAYLGGISFQRFTREKTIQELRRDRLSGPVER